jgi:hypothetical protein
MPLWGHAVVELVEALYYKPEGPGSSLDEVDFFFLIYLTHPAALWPSGRLSF